jgi:quinate/shikimate dehydrogenase (NAD+)
MGKRLLVGLIGANIQGSLSPALHEDAFAAAGISGHYHLMDLDRLHGRRLDDLLTAARTAGFAGVNITYPCKEAAFGLVDEVSPDARQIGAINTTTFHDGRMTGHNTDWIGFRRSFEETFGRGAVAGGTALLVGAGGAGRAAAFALLDLGAECLLVHDKDGARAEALVASFKASFGRRCARVAPEPRAALAQAVGVLNATQVGMLGFPGNPVPVDAIDAQHWVMDVIYTPLETELVQKARARGARAAGGAGMCVYQAAEAFRLFTGVAPDVARMRRTFLTAATLRDRSLTAFP